MSHYANQTKPTILIFVLFSALFCVAESALRKAPNVLEKALKNSRIAEQQEDGLTTFLFSEECVPFFENMFQQVLEKVDEIGNDDDIVEYACGEERRGSGDTVLELFEALEAAPRSDAGDASLNSCDLAYREKVLELKHFFIDSSSPYDTCKEEITKELAFVHENDRRALLETRRDPERKLFCGCSFYNDGSDVYFDGDDDDYTVDEYFTFHDLFLLFLWYHFSLN